MNTKRVTSELMLRVNSALILIVLSLSLTYVGPHTFTLLILFFATVMGWEWGRVVRGKGFDVLFALQTLATLGAGVLTLLNHPIIAACEVMVATFAMFWSDKLFRASPDPWWSAAGVYYAGFPTVVLIAIRQDPDYGFYAIIYLFLVVWCADTGAFFVGKTLGGPKLAPVISPNKTWSGLLGGAVIAGLAGVAFAVWFGKTSILALGLQSFLLALASQVGDLGESALKRVFGVKHSSSLIPGHGGVLDRLDGLVFAAISAGILAATSDPLRPGKALLMW